MPNPDTFPSLETLQSWYSIGKIIGAVGGVGVAAYKVVRWFQDIRAKDLKEIHSGILRLDTGMEKQTVALVSELKELRGDLRAYIPLAVQSRATKKPARKKTKPKAKPKAKPKTA